MILPLKPYQTDVLDSLSKFLKQCTRSGRPEAAFREAQERLGRVPLDYIPVHADGLDEDLPYVCARVPTGGGKTLLACHAIGIAMRDYLHTERSIALWLV